METPHITISLNRIRIRAFHGVLPQEHSVGNTFQISLSITLPCPAVNTDRIEQTADYAALARIVKQQMAIPSALLEHVAGRIRNNILQQFPQTLSGSITIEKLLPPIPGTELRSAAVTLRF